MTALTHSLRLPKIAILYGPLLHYRIALFNKLCDSYDVTVFATSTETAQSGLRFRVEVISPIEIGRFKFRPRLRDKLRRQQFDACIVFLDITDLSAIETIFIPIAPRTLVWGAWLTAATLDNR